MCSILRFFPLFSLALALYARLCHITTHDANERCVKETTIGGPWAKANHSVKVDSSSKKKKNRNRIVTHTISIELYINYFFFHFNLVNFELFSPRELIVGPNEQNWTISANLWIVHSMNESNLDRYWSELSMWIGWILSCKSVAKVVRSANEWNISFGVVVAVANPILRGRLVVKSIRRRRHLPLFEMHSNESSATVVASISIR